MRKYQKIVVGALMMAMLVLAGVGSTVSSASADDSKAEFDTATVMADGRSFGADEGAVVIYDQVPIIPGGGPQGIWWDDGPTGDVVPMIYWGSSYAYTDEKFEVYYIGRAKAAANVHDGQRIVEVCIWFTRYGSRKSDTVCSTATTTGYSWIPAGEKTVSCWDSFNPWAAETILNIKTTRIPPNLF